VRTIKQTAQFKRDLKRERRGPHREILEAALLPVLEQLAADLSLDPRLRDHPLIGQWRDFRDCHIKPDLVLIYQKPDAENLNLVRLGSHAQLGL